MESILNILRYSSKPSIDILKDIDTFISEHGSIIKPEQCDTLYKIRDVYFEHAENELSETIKELEAFLLTL